MSLIYADSFNGYTTTEIPNYWTDDIALYSSVMTNTPLHYGTQVLRPGVWGIQHAFAFPGTFTVGFAYYPKGYNNLVFGLKTISTAGTTTRLQVNLDLDGTLKLTRPVGPSTVLAHSSPKLALTPATRYYYLEFTTGLGAAVLNEIRIDGNLAFSGTLNTIGTTPLDSGQNIEFTDGGFFSDLYITSLDGTNPSGPIGETGIACLFPTADGSFAEWTPLTGTSHFAMVNEKPADMDTSYNFGGTSGQRDTYKVSTTIVNNTDVISAVELVQLVKFDGVGASQFNPFIVVAGSTNAGGINTALSTYIPAQFTIYNTNPISSATWTGTQINQTEWGIKIT